MNTNQEIPINNQPQPISATSILSNFLNKKAVTEDQQSADALPQLTESETKKSPPVAEILSRLQNKKEKAAVNLGISAGEVETMPFDLSQLETEGIFLNVDCRGFSTLERQIEWKSLGVELPAQGAVRLSPPRAGLLPDKYRRKLMRAASQAHHALNKFSFRFTLCETVWGTSEYKWIPWNAFENFE
nr:hypothetical protein [Pyrinomonadaceae bacterium]